MPTFTLRTAGLPDAEAISAVLIASITQLCSADHGNDPKVIADWTANKTPGQIGQWLLNEQIALLVAETSEGTIAGVGAADLSGRIILNYVSPAHCRQGVSRAILAGLEEVLAQQGVRTANLTATRTALEFYRAAAWQQCGPEQDDFGFPGYPMQKLLG